MEDQELTDNQIEKEPQDLSDKQQPQEEFTKAKKWQEEWEIDTVTIKNLEVIEITNDGVLLIKGLVPGSLNSLVVVKKLE